MFTGRPKDKHSVKMDVISEKKFGWYNAWSVCISFTADWARDITALRSEPDSLSYQRLPSKLMSDSLDHFLNTGSYIFVYFKCMSIKYNYIQQQHIHVLLYCREGWAYEQPCVSTKIVTSVLCSHDESVSTGSISVKFRVSV